MLMSVLMSSPGPLVVGLGLIAGRSSTQLADFVRRSSELLALIVAYIVYRMTTRDGITDLDRKARLEQRSNLFVGAVMVLSGASMLFITLFSENTEKGNLYRAKSLMDICVTIALSTVALFPGSSASTWLDFTGSVIVALYLIRCGIKTIREQKGTKSNV
ncbi:MAG: transporter [Firmicutes bacterium]|nr:transporter [Bacillota bacterium]